MEQYLQAQLQSQTLCLYYRWCVQKDSPLYTCQHFSLIPGLRWGLEKLSFKPGLIYSFILFRIRHPQKAKCERKAWFCSSREIFGCRSMNICIFDVTQNSWSSTFKATGMMFSNMNTSITSWEIHGEIGKRKPCISTFPWKCKKGGLNIQIWQFRKVAVSNDKGFRCNSVKLMAALC